MPTSRRSFLIGLPALVTAPGALIAGPDPLRDLVARWYRQATIINQTPFQSGQDAVDPALVREWETIEAAMIGTRPTTPGGAVAALRLAHEELTTFYDQDHTTWLVAAGLGFMEGQPG